MSLSTIRRIIASVRSKPHDNPLKATRHQRLLSVPPLRLARAEKAGTGYQTMMNEALRKHLSETDQPVLIGCALGMILFAFVPVSLISWIIMPIGMVFALWVAFRKVNGGTPRYHCLVALTWTLIAVLGDYLFIVKALKPTDGYSFQM